MAYLSQYISDSKPLLHERVLAQLPVRAKWKDKTTGKEVSVDGVTENIGETGALVNFRVLPPVGSEVSLLVMDEKKKLVQVLAEVIRVERDPMKPLAALAIMQNIKKWKQTAVKAGKDWVAKRFLEYEEEWIN
jgi:predicted transcriptional regulator